MPTAPTSALPSLPSASAPSAIIGDVSITPSSPLSHVEDLPTAETPGEILGDPSITPTSPLSHVVALPTATASTGSIAPPTVPTRKKITVTGSTSPDVDGEYYENGEWTSVSPGYPVFTKDDVEWNEFLSISRIAFNGSQWALEHFDEFGEMNAIWMTTDSPAVASPELAEDWTPDGTEEGTLVLTAEDTAAPLAAPVTVLPSLPTATAPTPILD